MIFESLFTQRRMAPSLREDHVKSAEGTNGVKPHILPPELEEVASSRAAEHEDAAQRPNVCRKAVPADIGPHLRTNLELSKKIANLGRHIVGRSTAGMSIEVEGILSFFSKKPVQAKVS